jgi:ribosomal protein S27AE
MVILTKAPNVVIAQHWINVLSTAGIRCEMHNRYLHGALGEIPADQCAPELWLVDERDAPLARHILLAVTNNAGVRQPQWHCPRCGETLEAQFTLCWQCGTPRDPRDG